MRHIIPNNNYLTFLLFIICISVFSQEDTWDDELAITNVNSDTCQCDDKSFQILDEELYGKQFDDAFERFKVCRDYMDDVNFYPNYYKFKIYFLLQDLVLGDITKKQYELLEMMTDDNFKALDNINATYVDPCNNPMYLKLKDKKSLNEIQDDYLDELNDDCEDAWDIDLDKYGLLDRYKRPDSLLVKFKYTWDEVLKGTDDPFYFPNHKNKDTDANVLFGVGGGTSLLGFVFIVLGASILSSSDLEGDITHIDYSPIPKAIMVIGGGVLTAGITVGIVGGAVKAKNKRARQDLIKLIEGHYD